MTLTEHGDARVDDWFWLRERDDPAVRAHLEAENAYAASVLAPSDELRERIFDEIKARIEETDISAPVPRDDWEYVTRTVEGLQYAIHVRRPRGGGEEQVLLDENVEAEGHPYFALGGFAITPDHAVVAYSVDTSGGERYALRFRDLTTGRDFADVVDDVTYGLAWADDARTCFYVRLDDAMRPWQVWRHELGTEAAADVARLPRRRRAVLRHRPPHAQRRVRAGRLRVEDAVRDLVRPRERSDRGARGRGPA